MTDDERDVRRRDEVDWIQVKYACTRDHAEKICDFLHERDRMLALIAHCVARLKGEQ